MGSSWHWPAPPPWLRVAYNPEAASWEQGEVSAQWTAGSACAAQQRNLGNRLHFVASLSGGQSRNWTEIAIFLTTMIVLLTGLRLLRFLAVDPDNAEFTGNFPQRLEL